jgi:Cys-rich repeat protein
MQKKCIAGCTTDADCAMSNDGPHCNPATHGCVGCLSDTDCPAGETCSTGSNLCFPGCNAMHACPATETCCGSFCYDLQKDANHCGACGTACTAATNAQAACTSGACTVACTPGWADCDGNPANGCEWNVLQDGPCACTPGKTEPCYQGPPGTENVGICKGGTQTCDAAGTGWGPCVGQVLPKPETSCTSTTDNNCNGILGDVTDIDGDGWTVCNGDCCEIPSQCGGINPALVNPGAFEIPGDGVDNNCDGTVDNPITTVCSTANKFTGVTGTDVIKAMDICQFTTLNPPLPMKIWGVISATQLHADGSATVASEAQNSQTAIKTKFGTGGVVPKMNATMAVISSGMARDAADPGWVVPIPGTSFTSAIAFPGAPPLSTYVNAHGGNLLPGTCGANPCPVGTGANDSINIHLQIRVPTNAQGFSYNFRFYSAEYQSFQCTSYNDYYLAMLTSGAMGIPADHNISFDALNNAVSVNNGFFQDCGGNGQNCNACPGGIGSLKGTGFDQVSGGSTEWLTTDSPAVPGEVMTLELMVFDVSDQIFDTLVLLDNFRWDLTPVTLGTHT